MVFGEKYTGNINLFLLILHVKMREIVRFLFIIICFIPVVCYGEGCLRNLPSGHHALVASLDKMENAR